MANEVHNLVVNGTTYPVGGLLVTITTTTSGSSITNAADKTAQEIFDALNAGIMPVFYISSNSRYYPMTHAYNSSSSYTVVIGGTTFSTSSASGYPSNTTAGGGDN